MVMASPSGEIQSNAEALDVGAWTRWIGLRRCGRAQEGSEGMALRPGLPIARLDTIEFSGSSWGARLDRFDDSSASYAGWIAGALVLAACWSCSWSGLGLVRASRSTSAA